MCKKLFVLSTLLFVSPPLHAWAESVQARVTASGLNVRTEEGAITDAIEQSTMLEVLGNHPDGERIKIRYTRGGRPREGYVYKKYVRREGSHGVVEAEIEGDALALRSAPSLSNSTWKCAVKAEDGNKKNTVLILNEPPKHGDEVTWVKVKLPNPLPGCPDTGYMSHSYLKPFGAFDDLKTEAVAQKDCDGAECKGKGRTETNAEKDMQDLGKKLGDKIKDERGDGPFIAGVKAMIKNPSRRPASLKVSRGMVQMPLLGKRGNIGPCGSHHYFPRPNVFDKSRYESTAFANPTTACVLTSVLQDWKKNFCPNGGGCRIAWGDISHEHMAEFHGHASHNRGYCIDIRPMRKPSSGFADSPLAFWQDDYDPKMTAKFIQFLKSKGANTRQLFFNDPNVRRQTGAKYASGHHNHIHVCFPPNDTTNAVCNNLKVDSNVCPEISQ